MVARYLAACSSVMPPSTIAAVLIASLTAAGILFDELSIKMSIEQELITEHIPGYINIAILLLDQVPDPS